MTVACAPLLKLEMHPPSSPALSLSHLSPCCLLTPSLSMYMATTCSHLCVLLVLLTCTLIASTPLDTQRGFLLIWALNHVLSLIKTLQWLPLALRRKSRPLLQPYLSSPLPRSGFSWPSLLSCGFLSSFPSQGLCVLLTLHRNFTLKTLQVWP